MGKEWKLKKNDDSVEILQKCWNKSLKKKMTWEYQNLKKILINVKIKSVCNSTFKRSEKYAKILEEKKFCKLWNLSRVTSVAPMFLMRQNNLMIDFFFPVFVDGLNAISDSRVDWRIGGLKILPFPESVQISRVYP